MIEDIYSLEVEQHCLGGLLNDGTVLPEIDFFVKETDFFQKIHQTIYLVLRGMLLTAERVDPVLLSNKIAQYGVKHHGDLSVYEYVEMLSYKKPTKQATIDSYSQLLGYRIRRDALNKMREIARLIQKPGDLSTVGLIGKMDQLYLDWSREVLKNHGKQNIEICDPIESIVENTRLNPPNEKDLMLGPFPKLNSIFGSISENSNITVIGARSGVGKTSISLFYQIYLAVTYDIPVLWMDFSEMTVEQLQMRAVCVLTRGRVPLWAIRNGDWAKNEEWCKLVRGVLPITKKIKIYYEQVAGLKANDVIKKMRSYAYKFGLGNKFLTCFDYLKPLDSDDRNSTEWGRMGSFIGDIKTFITDEIPLPFWTSLQLNRSGITTNKKLSELQDNEGAFSISDRILQQSSHSFLLRWKVNEELEMEGGRFGNMAFIPLKYRELGKEALLANRPVKLPSGAYAKNYLNLASSTFFYEEKGDLNDMVLALNGKYDISKKKPKNLEDGDIL